MSLGAIGGVGSPMPQANPSGPARAASEPRNNGGDELTTITTQCDKDHKHNPSCPHTVSTRPAPEVGAPGHLLDVYA